MALRSVYHAVLSSIQADYITCHIYSKKCILTWILGSWTSFTLYCARSVAFSSSVSTLCAGTKICFVILTRSSCSKNTSILYFDSVCNRVFLANGVNLFEITINARCTFSDFILSQSCFIEVTPTFSSSGKKTKIW